MPGDYYQLLDDMAFPRRWFLKAPVGPEDREIDPRLFTAGRRLDVAGPLRIPLRRPGEALDFTLADFDMPVLRADFADALAEAAGDDFQRIPVTVQGSDGRFDVLNVLPLVRCLDEERSGVSYWTEADGRPDKVGQYRMVADLRVRPEAVGPHRIFRVEGWKVALIVAEPVKRILEQARGAVFRPVS